MPCYTRSLDSAYTVPFGRRRRRKPDDAGRGADHTRTWRATMTRRSVDTSRATRLGCTAASIVTGMPDRIPYGVSIPLVHPERSRSRSLTYRYRVGSRGSAAGHSDPSQWRSRCPEIRLKIVLMHVRLARLFQEELCRLAPLPTDPWTRPLPDRRSMESQDPITTFTRRIRHQGIHHSHANASGRTSVPRRLRRCLPVRSRLSPSHPDGEQVGADE
jgi:hypothetical protein